MNDEYINTFDHLQNYNDKSVMK